MRDDHVDAQLGLVVEEAADAGEPAPAGDQRVEVDDLGADGAGDLVGGDVFLLRPAHRQAQVAAPATGGRDQQALVDLPRDRAVMRAEVVLRRVEAQQRERARDHHDLTRVGRVADLQQAERDAREEAPVGARQPLEVLGRPDPVELCARQRDLGLLTAADPAALGVLALVGLRVIFTIVRGPGARRWPTRPPRVALPHSSSTSTGVARGAPRPGRRRSAPARPPQQRAEDVRALRSGRGRAPAVGVRARGVRARPGRAAARRGTCLGQRRARARWRPGRRPAAPPAPGARRARR